MTADDTVVFVRLDVNGYQAIYNRITEGEYGGVDDGDFELVGNDNLIWWRKKL